MAFETLTDLSTDNAVALGGYNKKTKQDNPTTITGYYIGSKQVDSPKSKTGKAALHVFQTAEGNVGVWGKTDLDQKLSSAVVGALTRVTFTGMQETKNNPMYKYKVEIDRSNKIEVSSTPAVTSSTYTDETYSQQLDSYDDDAELDADLDEAPPVAARAPSTPVRTPSPEQQARVQALLSKRK